MSGPVADAYFVTVQRHSIFGRPNRLTWSYFCADAFSPPGREGSALLLPSIIPVEQQLLFLSHKSMFRPGQW
jgi:hypothetical protein